MAFLAPAFAAVAEVAAEIFTLGELAEADLAFGALTATTVGGLGVNVWAAGSDPEYEGIGAGRQNLPVVEKDYIFENEQADLERKKRVQDLYNNLFPVPPENTPGYENDISDIFGPSIDSVTVREGFLRPWIPKKEYAQLFFPRRRIRTKHNASYRSVHGSNKLYKRVYRHK